MTNSHLLRILALLTLCWAPSTFAQWSLSGDASTLSFVTVKADHVAEVHTFDHLEGMISEDGEVTIEIALASVNTLIPIRNERMQEMLFDVGMFPTATISGAIELAELRGLRAGETRELSLDFSLDIRGVSNDYSAEVMATRTRNGLIVNSLKPVVVNADAHDLSDGVESLREVAGLPSISRAVPVTFTVVFEADS